MRALFELDLAVHNQVQSCAGKSYRRLSLQCLASVQSALSERLPYCVLDLTLRSNSGLLEKLAHAHVECIFVHGYLLSSAGAICQADPRLGMQYSGAMS